MRGETFRFMLFYLAWRIELPVFTVGEFIANYATRRLQRVSLQLRDETFPLDIDRLQWLLNQQCGGTRFSKEEAEYLRERIDTIQKLLPNHAVTELKLEDFNCYIQICMR